VLVRVADEAGHLSGRGHRDQRWSVETQAGTIALSANSLAPLIGGGYPFDTD